MTECIDKVEIIRHAGNRVRLWWIDPLQIAALYPLVQGWNAANFLRSLANTCQHFPYGDTQTMNRSRRTVADLRALRGTGQLSMIHIESLDEARAAAQASVDLLSIEQPIWNERMREVAGDCFVFVGLLYGQLCTFDDYIRASHSAMQMGGDAVYCAASNEIVERLTAEGIPVCGHTGLIPSKRTWTGGFKAVGKTAETARLVYKQVKDLELAGAFAAEIEVVPARVATEIAKRTSVFLLSMGAGAGCDAQYLFSSDILGYTDGHTPRHAKQYRDFRAELDRLQLERTAAFNEFHADVHTGIYPMDDHLVGIEDEQFNEFLAGLD
jgi:3-methyl-2-oxobutanoate hydroxymethyltransferase